MVVNICFTVLGRIWLHVGYYRFLTTIIRTMRANVLVDKDNEEMLFRNLITRYLKWIRTTKEK